MVITSPCFNHKTSDHCASHVQRGVQHKIKQYIMKGGIQNDC